MRTIAILAVCNEPIQKPTKFKAPHCRRSGSTFELLARRFGFYREKKKLVTNRLQIMVVQHELRCGEVGFALDSELIGPMGDPGPPKLFHDVVEVNAFVAGMENSRGRDGPCEAFAPAARRRRLIWMKVSALMTCGGIGSE